MNKVYYMCRNVKHLPLVEHAILKSTFSADLSVTKKYYHTLSFSKEPCEWCNSSLDPDYLPIPLIEMEHNDSKRD